MDLKFDETTGDIDVSSGLQFTTGATELRQRITVGVTINLNEFFTHINYGLPWLRNEADNPFTDVQYFLGEDEQTSIQYIVKELDRYILSIDQVVSVTSNYDFVNTTRTLYYTPSIVGQDGEEVNFPPYKIDL